MKRAMGVTPFARSRGRVGHLVEGNPFRYRHPSRYDFSGSDLWSSRLSGATIGCFLLTWSWAHPRSTCCVRGGTEMRKCLANDAIGKIDTCGDELRTSAVLRGWRGSGCLASQLRMNLSASTILPRTLPRVSNCSQTALTGVALDGATTTMTDSLIFLSKRCAAVHELCATASVEDEGLRVSGCASQVLTRALPVCLVHVVVVRAR